MLEVRGLGLVTGRNANDEIWRAIDAKANNHSTYMSQNPTDYPDNKDSRMTYLGVATGLAFQLAARHSVEYWPVPVFIWEPPKASHVSRPANELSGIRQEASLNISTMPDSMVTLLVSRSDRVDRLIRPYAVEQTENVDKNTTEYDITKLWNFFWEKNNGEGPGSFEAYYQEQQKAAGIQPRAFLGFMSAQWWQTQLPDFWKTISNKGPGEFKPTPYIPVRWTTWQVRQFDNAPLLGYLHRPIDVKLADAHGKPLKTAQQVQALKAGWQQAVDTLPTGETPKRIFYDTTGDRAWVAPINQALAQSGPSAPSLDDVKEGYDIGRRIGNTGISSPLVQIGLGLIASYHEGGASATIHRRPNGTATIVMVSPPTHKQPDVNPFR
nr:DUF2875 family protein [Burkholderia pseudomallei]